MTRLGRSLLLITLLIAAPFAFASNRLPDVAPGKARYLMVLWEQGTPIPGSNGKHVGKVEEPDVKQLGGIVVEERRNERVIDIPVQAAGQLRRHRSVIYLQRLWMGEPIEELHEPPQPSRGRAEFATEDDPLLTWGPKEYTYDGSGNIVRIGKTGAYDNYTYDTAGRLIESTVGGKNETYAYDEFGNLISKGVVGANATSIPVDGASNRLQGASYDAAGNVTTRGDEHVYEGDSYAYDSFNMLVRYKGGRRMLYDVNDERLGVIIDAHLSRWWVRDLEGRVLREYRGVPSMYESVWAWEQDYVYAEGQLVAGERVLWDGGYDGGNSMWFGGIRHHHLDHLGSVRLVTNANGRSVSEHDYYPFGVTPTKAYQEQINWGDPHIDAMRFAGHQREFLGFINTENTEYLDYMHARYYDPNLGRFLSVDPSTKYDLQHPQTWNRYSYAHNNPLLKVDPDGRDALSVTYVGYRVQTPVGRRPLGHSGITIVQGNGRTSYYEFGRYRPGGEVRRLRVPDLQMQNGVPTRESLKAHLSALSQKAGQGLPVSGAYFTNDTAAQMQAFAEARKQDSSKQGTYGLGGNNCATFTDDVLSAGGENLDVSVINTPGNVMQEQQDNADFSVHYDPKKDELRVTCREGAACPP